MIEIKVWEAEDGEQFSNAQDCLLHETKCELIDLIKKKDYRWSEVENVLEFIKENRNQILRYWRRQSAVDRMNNE